MQENDLYESVQIAINSAEIEQKLTKTNAVVAQWQSGKLRLDNQTPPLDIAQPGRPAELKLVSPSQLPRRTFNSVEGKAALVHAIAHIEFNAIDLALDAVYRFRGLPREYYDDWLSIAAEEAHHFKLVWKYLQKLGYDYGQFPAHNGLWDMAERTAGDVLVRMALVPRVLEARGLDVTPGIMARFQGAGDNEFAAILAIIQQDEEGHVEAGSRWFHYLCDQRGLSRQETFEQLFQQYTEARIKLPLQREARQRAGFTKKELDYLEGCG